MNIICIESSQKYFNVTKRLSANVNFSLIFGSNFNLMVFPDGGVFLGLDPHSSQVGFTVHHPPPHLAQQLILSMKYFSTLIQKQTFQTNTSVYNCQSNIFNATKNLYNHVRTVYDIQTLLPSQELGFVETISFV